MTIRFLAAAFAAATLLAACSRSADSVDQTPTQPQPQPPAFTGCRVVKSANYHYNGYAPATYDTVYYTYTGTQLTRITYPQSYRTFTYTNGKLTGTSEFNTGSSTPTATSVVRYNSAGLPSGQVVSKPVGGTMVVTDSLSLLYNAQNRLVTGRGFHANGAGQLLQVDSMLIVYNGNTPSEFRYSRFGYPNATDLSITLLPTYDNTPNFYVQNFGLPFFYLLSLKTPSAGNLHSYAGDKNLVHVYDPSNPTFSGSNKVYDNTRDSRGNVLSHSENGELMTAYFYECH